MTMATTIAPCEGRTEHHLGCECHEAKRDAEVERCRATIAEMGRSQVAHIAEVERQRDEARAEADRLRGRLGVLERAVLMADGADYDESTRDCLFCGEDWQEDGHELACPRRMADVIRRGRKGSE